MMNPEFVGMAGATLTTISFAPQALRVIRTKDTAAISLTMYILFVAGLLCWEAYGLMIGSKPVIFANIVTLFFASVILFMKLKGMRGAL